MSIKKELMTVLKREQKFSNKNYTDRVDVLVRDLAKVDFSDVKKVIQFIDKALDQCRDTVPREELHLIRNKMKDSL